MDSFQENEIKSLYVIQRNGIPKERIVNLEEIKIIESLIKLEFV